MRNGVCRAHGFGNGCGVFRWMLSPVVLAFAAYTAKGATIPTIKSLAVYVTICVFVTYPKLVFSAELTTRLSKAALSTMVLWYPMSDPMSRTNPNATRTCVILVLAMATLWSAAVGTGASMIVLTKGYEDAPTWPGHTCSPMRHKCFQPNDSSMSWLCTIFSSIAL